MVKKVYCPELSSETQRYFVYLKNKPKLQRIFQVIKVRERDYNGKLYNLDKPITMCGNLRVNDSKFNMLTMSPKNSSLTLSYDDRNHA